MARSPYKSNAATAAWRRNNRVRDLRGAFARLSSCVQDPTILRRLLLDIDMALMSEGAESEIRRRQIMHEAMMNNHITTIERGKIRVWTHEEYDERNRKKSVKASRVEREVQRQRQTFRVV